MEFRRLSPFLGLLVGACAHAPQPGGTEFRLPNARVLEIASRSRAIPARFTQPATIEALRAFVQGGGGLLLRGRALRLLSLLGLVDEAPESEVELHGFTRASQGFAVGLGITPTGSAELSIGSAPQWLVRGKLARAEIDAVEVSSIRQRGAVFAEYFRKTGERLERRGDGLLCGWRVGSGRVLALGLGSAAPIPDALRESMHRWLAGGDEGSSHVVLLDKQPEVRVDGWGPPARDTRETFGAMAVRLAARDLESATLSASRLRALREHGVEIVVVDDDGAPLSDWTRRIALVREHRMQFGLATDSFRSELGPLLDWHSQSGTPPLLDLLVELPARGEPAFDAAMFHRARRNAITDVWAARPMPGGGGVVSYLPATAGVRADARTPGADAGLLRLLPPSIYRILELDGRRAKGAWADTMWSRVAAFTRGRPGASVLLRADTGDEDGWRHTLELLSVLRDPLHTAACFRADGGGAYGFESIATVRTDSDEPKRDASKPEVVRLAPYALRNRYFRLTGNSLDVDPDGVGRFESATRVTNSWTNVVIHGMRVGSPELFERLIAPTFEELDVGGVLQIGRPITLRPPLEVGRYSAECTVEAIATNAILEVRGPLGRRAFFGLAPGRPRAIKIGFDSPGVRGSELGFRLYAGETVEIGSITLRGIGLESEVDSMRAHAGLHARRTRMAQAGHFVVERVVATRGDLPALVQTLRFRKSIAGLRLERRVRFEGYSLTARAGGLLLTGEGKPTLEIRMLARGRMRSSIDGDAWVLRGHPRAFEECVYAILIPDAIPASVTRDSLERALLAVAHHEPAPAGAERVAAAPGGAIVPTKRDGPTAPAGAEILERRDRLLRIRVGADAKPGQRFGLRFPGVAPKCHLDRAAWSFWHGDTVWLPRKPGDYVVEWTSEKPVGPHLIASRAAIRACRYDDTNRELTIEISDAVHEPGSTHILRVAGPAPVSVRGAAILGVEAPWGFTLQAPPGRVVVRFAR